MINKIIQELRISGARTTKHKWIKKVKKHADVNIGLPTPKGVTKGQHQVVQEYNSVLWLRLFANGKEVFRILFYDYGGTLEEHQKMGYKESLIGYKYKKLGTSNAYAFMPCSQQMGYHEIDSTYLWKSHIIDEVNHFRYIDLSKAKLNAMRLIRNPDVTYATELLIKQKYYRLAEIYVNDMSYCNVQFAVKHHPDLLKKPSKQKLEFATQTKVKYQYGMLKHKHYYKFDKLLNYTTWDKFKQYDYDIVDYLDYRENNCKFDMPDYPNDLQLAKEKLQDYMDENKYKKEEKIIQKRDLKIIRHKKYLAIQPRSIKEIKENGKKLHHCILQYTPRYSKGEIDLYIIRNDDKDVASVEVKNGKVIQCRGKYNKDLTSQFKELLDKITNNYKEATCT